MYSFDVVGDDGGGDDDSDDFESCQFFPPGRR